MVKLIKFIQNILVIITGRNTVIRRFLKRIYMYFPRKYRDSYLLEKTIGSIGKMDSIKFIQIGANDGIHGDPLYHYVRKNNWIGLMVEPNPAVFKKLIENHTKSKSKISFCKSAIGNSGTFTLFWIKEDSAIASFDRKHVERHLNGENYDILEEQVNVIPFTQLIIENKGFSSVNILLIDTEGWDSKIVQSIDFRTFYSDIIIFETTHVEPVEFKKTIKFLEQNNYACFTSRGDTTAIKKNTNLQPLKKVLNSHEKL